MSEEQKDEEVRDGYERFFSRFEITDEQFFQFGMDETICAPFDVAGKYWEKLKSRIENNEIVYIRRFTQDRKGRKNLLCLDFYKHILNENVRLDIPGNLMPGKAIRDLTGYARTLREQRAGDKFIRNYQVTHVFGRTKNAYTFMAPWNIVYMPKIVDPLTGHEAKGDRVKKFTTMLQEKIYFEFKPLIEDYNKLISDPKLLQRIDKYYKKASREKNYSQEEIKSLKDSIDENFTQIFI